MSTNTIKDIARDIPSSLPIKEIETEAPDIKSFYFDYWINSTPGQFVMLWLPKSGLKPFGICFNDGQRIGVTVCKRGDFTTALMSKKVGDLVGIAGPYGTGFTIDNDRHYIMMAGGYGAAPLRYLISQLRSRIDFCQGARNERLLLFAELGKKDNVSLCLATDDGSSGHHGLVTDLLPDIIKKNNDRNILVVCCGPEMMEKKVLDICNEHGVDCEISVERYMKCGFGMCGQCSVDDLGFCACERGPVMKRDLLNQIKEFGVYHRDASGQKIYF
ncbi:dihydroorotate dehydrogenase electron transfer subunit [Patescibacteria group bacterium]|nr:dihydroorotate dehydrogenase electron transfer subunit [Patescibacteria group bacterium]